MNKLKDIIISILPFGILSWILRKRYSKNSIIQYDNNLPDLKDVDSKFDSIISVQGLGFSGSGAVVDFLREFPCCLTYGTIDIEGSKTKGNKQQNGEINILRHSGGLFEFEHYLNDNNIFLKDALLKRFGLLLNGIDFFKNKDAMRLANQFYNQMIDFVINTRGHNDYNSHLANPFVSNENILVMKAMSINEYRSLCRRFLTSLFNMFYDSKYKCLVLDQLCGDFNFDESRNKEYLPNLKTIFVYRDPRDIYSYALLKNVSWIPHDDVDEFVKWYRLLWNGINRDSSEFLIIRFEDLVNNYEDITSDIMRYLNLDSSLHKFKFASFDPKESVKNIAIWKKMDEHVASMERIANNLSEFCYNS